MLTVNDLGCVRNDLPLLKGVNFVLQPGQAIRLKGHNGVGKTTLLKILCGLRRPDLGSVTWSNTPIHRSHEFKQSLRFVGHNLGIKAELSIADNWRFAAALLAADINTKQCDQLVSQIGLPSQLDWLAGELSAGQQRRVALARLQIGQPKLWLLDEPFVSLDTAGHTLLTRWIDAFLKDGGSVLFTAHHEVDFVCDLVDLERHRASADDVLDWPS